VIQELESLINQIEQGSPLRYPLRVAVRFAKTAYDLAFSALEAETICSMVNPLGDTQKGQGEQIWADFKPNAPTFAKVQVLIGAGMAYRLIEAYGGTRLYIPKPQRLSEYHRLSTTLGYSEALILAQHFGDSSVKVPTGHWAILHARNDLIHERYAKGETAAKLAREYGMAEDSIYRIVNRARSQVYCLVETFDLFEGSAL
jgi:Mor family transcriptional regulator